ncbi:hypothetical protein ABG067_004497 [Albugo candida]
MLLPFDTLEVCPDDARLKHELLDKLVILKLNGGLGTTLGCQGPKSAIEVRQGLSFLDLTVRQVEYLNSLYGVDVPLVLMNSFNTHEETVRIIRKYRMHNLSIHTFNQKYDQSGRDKWYPPGHGDVYHALFDSGLLENLINQGKEYIFISNVDNLGATVNLTILYHMINEESEFVMEVTDRTRADVQGGTLVLYRDKPYLLEMSQVPAQHVEEFRSINRFKQFNTNNLWVKFRAIQKLVAQEIIDIPPLVSYRTIKQNNVKVLQLETAAGAASHFFKNFVAISVARSRFLPVKSSSDLFLVQSNLYQVKHGSLVMNPARQIPSIPIVKLGLEFQILQLETAAGAASHFFKNFVAISVARSRFLPVKSSSDLFLVQSNLYQVKHGSLVMNPARQIPSIPIVKLGLEFQSAQQYSERFEKGIPNILELDHLTVAGDIKFGSDITLKGTVILVANEGCHIDLPDGTVLEDHVVTGNLRILDH